MAELAHIEQIPFSLIPTLLMIFLKERLQSLRLVLVFALGSLFFAPQAFAQEVAATEVGGENSRPAAATLSEKQATLLLLNKQLNQLRQELEEASKAETEAESDFDQNAARDEIDRLSGQIETNLGELSKVATGVDLESMGGLPNQRLNIQEEIQLLVEPVIREVKEATSSQQEVEKLRASITSLSRKYDTVRAAIQNLKETISQTVNPDLKKTLKEQLNEWESTSLELRTQLSVARYQLDERKKNSPTMWVALSNTIANFFRNRGTHLVIGILAAVIVVILLRRLRHFVIDLRSKKEKKAATFSGRMINLLFIFLTVVGGIVAFLLVLYLANDWVLLTLTVLLLLGMIWASKATIPAFFEQAKLMLNLGTVRSGERLLIGGIPWQVQRVNPYTDLVNPSLEGGLIRLPLRDLSSLHSRPVAGRELWFPCEQDDWVQLSDGTFGKVIIQTPDSVNLIQLGGSRKTIPTADFLALHPENLSKNFRISVTFGIDYALQKIATSEVPALFEAAIQRGLLDKVTKDELLSVKVFFDSAAASSLDYRIVADFAGALAPRRALLRNAISAICVDTCNARSWSIPYTQITVHQAEAARPVVEERGKKLP